MKSTFSVIYYLKRQVVKKDGTVPVMGRITVDGSQTQFSCKLSVDPKLWDTKGGRVTGRCRAAQLARIRQMSGQVSRGSAGEYQADERASVVRLSSRVSG